MKSCLLKTSQTLWWGQGASSLLRRTSTLSVTSGREHKTWAYLGISTKLVMGCLLRHFLGLGLWWQWWSPGSETKEFKRALTNLSMNESHEISKGWQAYLMCLSLLLTCGFYFRVCLLGRDGGGGWPKHGGTGRFSFSSQEHCSSLLAS